MFSRKHILVGGYPHKAADGGKALCEEMIRGFEKPVKILDCLFARDPQTWNMGFEQDTAFFTKHLGKENITTTLADPKIFLRQLQETEVLYIRGGRTDVLIEQLQKHPGWEQEVSGKTIVGSSAGADALVKYNYDLDTKKLGMGLGILPVKVLVHYGSAYNNTEWNWPEMEEILKNYGEDLPIVKLAEGQFEIIFSKDFPREYLTT